MKGRGRPNSGRISFVHPHPCLPAGRLTLSHQRGRGIDEEISNMFD